MSIVKDTVGVDVEDGTLASGIKLAAGLIPSTPISTTVQYVGELLDADVKRTEIISTFKSQIAGYLHVKTSDVTPELIESHKVDLPEWMQKEWNEASDVSGKTMNFAVRAAAGVAGMMMGGLFPIWIISLPAGFALGWVLGDMAEREFRNAREDLGGLSVTNLSKIIKKMSADGTAPDATLTATLMLAIHRPQDNTEELEEMVQKHIEAKEAKSTEVTDLEAFIQGEQSYLLGQIGTDVQAKFPAGTEVQDIVAQYLRTPKDVDSLLFKPDLFYSAIADDVSKHHIAKMRSQLKPHGQALLQDEQTLAQQGLPPVSPHAPKRGEQRGA
jgi:hypothetical protein